MLRKLMCLFGRHPYRYLGAVSRDEVYCCPTCGHRRVKYYTLRINRLD